MLNFGYNAFVSPKITTMQNSITNNRPTLLFILLAGFFVANALIAEFVGVKIFSLEQTFGIEPRTIALFGQESLAFNLTAGVLLWPVVFVMTDIINEYYGSKGVRLLSYLTAGLIIYAFVLVYLSIQLVPADFWPQSHINPSLAAEQKAELASKVGDYNEAFRLVFGQGLWIIVGSVIAFLVGQILDVFVFHRLKRLTGESKVWLRATGSTLVSQLIDSFVVLFIAFYIGADWPMSLVLAICAMNYFYKFLVAVLLTPVIYFAHSAIDHFLGDDLAQEMKLAAMAGR